MSSLSIAYGLIRFGAGLKAFLRDPISVEAANVIVRQRMQARDAAFLQMVERAIFANRTSPYRKLFQAAGCELEDVRTLVKQLGVEGTLQRLLHAGIYVTFEEFKGQKAAVRGNSTFVFRDTDFDNPLITAHYHTRTGGSRGRPTRIMIDLDYLAERAPLWCLWFAAHNLLSSPLVFLTPYYPGVVNLQLICAKFGRQFVKWFATGGGGSMTYRSVSAYVHALARRAGGLPKPEFITSRDARKVGQYLVGLVQDGLRPCVNASPSDAIHVCLAMQKQGIALHGVTFLLGYEPLTRARRELIEAAGAKAVMTYGFSEGGTVGQQCPRPAAPDDIHIASDAFAVIQRDRHPDNEQTADALLLTAIGSASPKVMLNAEIGDYAVLETRRCGCLFDELGYHRHLHTIRSSEKLTGLGVTFIGADVYRLLEDVLPRRFGGTPADYQLVEEQDAHGLPRCTLFVSPEVGDVDEKALVTEFLAELRKLRPQYPFMVNQWVEAGILRLVRRRPLPTARGKVLPFRTLGP